MVKSPTQITRVEAVQYHGPDWYTRVTEDSGRIVHYGPYRSRWAAQKLADLILSGKYRHGTKSGT
jgi:hypothetical protein